MGDNPDVITHNPGPPTCLSRIQSRRLWIAVFAEFFAQIIFVILNLLAITHKHDLREHSTYFGDLKVLSAVGFAHMALVHTTYQVSAGHINPAITIAIVLAGRMTYLCASLYIVAQCLGAVSGVLLSEFIVSTEDMLNSFDYEHNKENIPVSTRYISIVCIVFIIVLVYLASTDRKFPQMEYPSLPIGLTIILGNLCGQHYTGFRLIPSRYLGGVFASCSFDALSNFGWEAPLLGGVLASLIYTNILRPQTRPMRRFKSQRGMSKREAMSKSGWKSKELKSIRQKSRRLPTISEQPHNELGFPKTGQPDRDKLQSEKPQPEGRENRRSHRPSRRSQLYRQSYKKQRIRIDGEYLNGEENNILDAGFPSSSRSRPRPSALNRQRDYYNRRQKDQALKDAKARNYRNIFFSLYDYMRRDEKQRRRDSMKQLYGTDLDKETWKHKSRTMSMSYHETSV